MQTLFEAERALTVMLKATPETMLVGAETLKCVAEFELDDWARLAMIKLAFGVPRPVTRS